MPPKTPHDAQEAEQSGKRARKSVERLSSSQMQAKQYSAHALGVSLGALYGCAPDEEQAASACVAAGSSLETLICIRCKRADHEDKMLLCDLCDKGWHLFCLNPPLQAIPEGDWSCPHCAPAQDAAPRKETLLNAAVRAAEDPLDSAAAAESGGSLASPSTLAVMSDDALAQRDDAEAADASASSAKWSRPTREEGIGGGWMVGRRVQVWCDSRQAWREGSVQGVDFNDDRVHSVLFVDSGDEQTEFVNLSKLRWKLDRAEDSGDNPKTARQIQDAAPAAASLPPASPVKRGPGRPRKSLAQHASKASIKTGAAANEPDGQGARIVVAASRAVDPNACKEPLRKKHEMLMEALEDTPIYVAVGGAKGKKGRRDGTLQQDDSRKQLMVRSADKLETLDAFVQSQLGPKERPKEHVFLTRNDEPLVEYESTLSGYGRQKLVDGTRVRLMFDKDDWYSGKVIGYDGRTGRYRLVFEDGEELEARHALFEPEDGFFLDNGKDCGMVFRASASASCKAALAAEQDADKDRWRAPRAGEEAGGMWLVGRRIRVFWSFDSKFHEAVVEDYDPDVGAVDSRNFVGPVHRLRYDESKHMGIFPENLTKCVWNLDKSQDGDRPVSAVSKRVATALVQKSEESPLRDKLTQSSAGAKVRSSASNGRQGRAAKAVAGPAKPGASQVVDESECMWTAPHWKFKTGGSWLVGRKIKLYWDAERQWFAGKVLSYDGTPHAQDSHGNIGPVHEVYYDDGIFFENLECARWKLDANEGPSGNALVHEWERDAEQESKMARDAQHESQVSGKREQSKVSMSGKESAGRPHQSHVKVERNGRGHQDQKASADAGGGKRRAARVHEDDTESVASDDSKKRARYVGNRLEKDHGGARPEDASRSKTFSNSKTGVGAKSSLPGGKVVLKLPQTLSDHVCAEGGGTDSKRSSDDGDASESSSERTKKAKETERAAVAVEANGGAVAADAPSNQKEGVDLARLSMQDRRWTTPDELRRGGGKWLLDRCVRLYWDEDAQWFPGIVVDYDGRKDAEDSHGSKGPVHTIVYSDGQYLENLSTAKWQFDAKEGLAGVNVSGELEPHEADEAEEPTSGPASPKPGEEAQGDVVKPGEEAQGDVDISNVAAKQGKEVEEESGKGEDKGGSGWRGECHKLLGRLMRQESAIPFLEPVDPVAMNLPDYLDIIEKPMDLGTVKTKLERQSYTEPLQVLRDILLCFNNAIEYNPKSEPAHKMALAMHTCFTSLCNGSQLLRPVLRILDLSGGGVTSKISAPVGSPKKAASSPKKKAAAPPPTGKDAGNKAPAPAADAKSESASSTPLAAIDEKDHRKGAHSQKGGGGRNGRAIQDDEQFRLKIHTEGRVWTDPTGNFRQGGAWLLGRHIRVYWDDDRTWYAGVVTFFDASESAQDSHGNTGPVHDVYYEDGSFLENLGTAKWQYDASEGGAGHKVNLEETPGGQPVSSDKKAAPVSGAHRNPYAACDECRRRRIRCKHMHEAIAAELAKKKVSSKPPVGKAAAAAAPAVAGQLPSAASAAAATTAVTAGGPAPLRPAAEQLIGVKQDIWIKELQYYVVYGQKPPVWLPKFNDDAKFRPLLVDFIKRAFPDRSVLHPWMPDFQDHMFVWGYREKQVTMQGPEHDKALDEVVAVSGVQVLDGATMYRVTSENPTRHKWVAVAQASSTKLHRMAADFLFTAIGVLSLYMGRDKHSKFLRHLGVLEEYQRGWEAAEQGLPLNSGGGHHTGDFGPAMGAAAEMNAGGGVDLPLFDDGFFEAGAPAASAFAAGEPDDLFMDGEDDDAPPAVTAPAQHDAADLQAAASSQGALGAAGPAPCSQMLPLANGVHGHEPAEPDEMDCDDSTQVETAVNSGRERASSSLGVAEVEKKDCEADDKVQVSSSASFDPRHDNDVQACDKADDDGEEGETALDATTANGAETGGEDQEPSPTALVQEGEGKARECADTSGAAVKQGISIAEGAAKKAGAADEGCLTSPVDAAEIEATVPAAAAASTAASARSAAGLLGGVASAVPAQMPSEST